MHFKIKTNTFQIVDKWNRSELVFTSCIAYLLGKCWSTLATNLFLWILLHKRPHKPEKCENRGNQTQTSMSPELVVCQFDVSSFLFSFVGEKRVSKGNKHDAPLPPKPTQPHKAKNHKLFLQTFNFRKMGRSFSSCYVDHEEWLLLQELQELDWQVPMWLLLCIVWPTCRKCFTPPGLMPN